MTGTAWRAAVLVVTAWSAAPGVAAAQVPQAPQVPASEQSAYVPSPPFWAVKGVRADDVLHLRDMPAAESRSLAGIPANASGLKNLGCRTNLPSLEEWMRMSKVERDRGPTLWCRVEYRGKQGWVAGRFLKQDETAGRAQ